MARLIDSWGVSLDEKVRSLSQLSLRLILEEVCPFADELIAQPQKDGSRRFRFCHFSFDPQSHWEYTPTKDSFPFRLDYSNLTWVSTHLPSTHAEKGPLWYRKNSGDYENHAVTVAVIPIVDRIRSPGLMDNRQLREKVAENSVVFVASGTFNRGNRSMLVSKHDRDSPRLITRQDIKDAVILETNNRPEEIDIDPYGVRPQKHVFSRLPPAHVSFLSEIIPDKFSEIKRAFIQIFSRPDLTQININAPSTQIDPSLFISWETRQKYEK